MEGGRTDKHIVAKASIILLASNILLFILGYFLETLIVRNFGASGESDAWYVAYSIPDLFLKFLLFGALGVTFVPVFIEHLTQKREEEGWAIASSVINFSAVLLIIAVILV